MTCPTPDQSRAPRCSQPTTVRTYSTPGPLAQKSIQPAGIVLGRSCDGWSYRGHRVPWTSPAECVNTTVFDTTPQVLAAIA